MEKATTLEQNPIFSFFAGDPSTLLDETERVEVRIIGNNSLADFLDNAFRDGKIQVFGFPRHEEIPHLVDG